MDFFNLLEEKKTVPQKIMAFTKDLDREFSLKELYEGLKDVPNHSIRARLYTNLKSEFRRVGKGLYISKNVSNNSTTLVVEGCGRDLSEIPNGSIDAIITDHPWDCPSSHKGTNKKFANFDSYKYSIEDFEEKFRVLKKGGFLVENVPEENSNNYEYLFNIKKMAIDAGFKFYAPVPWIKGKLIHNTGRKAKNREMLLFFTKGKARCLRDDKQRGGRAKMSGTSFMLPVEFCYGPSHPSKKKVQTEKPVELYENIIKAVSVPGEIILDQNGGSLNLARAAINTGRHSISYEINEDVLNLSKCDLELCEAV